MTKSLVSLCCAAALLGLSFGSQASAQQPAPAAYGPPVATLDMAYLFRNHLRYKAMDEALRNEVSQAEGQFTGEQKAMQELAKRLNEYRPGSPEYKAVEEELAKKDADLRLRGAMLQKTFAEKKAKNYYDILQEVKNYVRWQAEEKGILLVVNFNGDEIDGANPQSVMRGLTDVVLYQHRSVDITPVILDLANRNVPVPQPVQNQALVPGVIPPRQ